MKTNSKFKIAVTSVVKVGKGKRKTIAPDPSEAGGKAKIVLAWALRWVPGNEVFSIATAPGNLGFSK